MTDERITAYLLQELSEEEAERFEEQCFAHEEWPAELDSAEQDLIDAYLRKELTAERRRRFEENYLTTDARKARVLTAQSFLQVLCPRPQKSTLGEKLRAFWQRPLIPQFATAVLVLALGLMFFVPLMQRWRSPQTFTRLDLTMSSPDRAAGVQAPKVQLPLASDALKVYLKLPEPSLGAVDYRVQWENVNTSLGNLKVESHDAESVVVIIPANDLTRGSYLLKLFKINRDRTEQQLPGNYFFTVE